MRLSEAMRLGAMLKPQGFDWIHRDGRTCALGAVVDAAGFALRDDQMYVPPEMLTLWPLLLEYRDQLCPACDTIRTGYTNTIVHLNDHHRWTREQIADWVQLVEERDTERTALPQSVDAVAKA